MTLSVGVNALKAAAEQLAERAKGDEELVERLLANPAKVLAETSGQPIPAGLIVTAARDAQGAVEVSASADPHFNGELDDASLEAVSGGATAIEYGLIAAGISLAIITGVKTLGAGLTHNFQNVGAQVK